MTVPDTAESRFGDFWRGWEEQLGTQLPAPEFTPGSGGDFGMSARAVTVADAVIADVRGESLSGTASSSAQESDAQVVLHVVRQNTWRFGRPRQDEFTVPAGHFMFHRTGPPTFEEARGTTATVLLSSPPPRYPT